LRISNRYVSSLEITTMRITLQCAACIIDDLRGALEDTADCSRRPSILAEAMAWLGSEFRPDRIPSYYITRVHRLLKQRTGLAMPFGELRARCNEAGLSVASRVARRLAAVEADLARLRRLCLWAIAGNHLDFRTVGTGYALSPADIESQLIQVVEEGLAIDHTGALLEVIRRGPRVLYLCDNVGEIALDRLLIQELQRYRCSVTAAVKAGPITSDAVLADAQAVGLTELVPVILTGPDTLGLPLDEMSAQVEVALQTSELVISKGQANYYALSEIADPKGPCGGLPGHVFCLLRTKCQPVAASLGWPGQSRINVAVRLGKWP
jgi:uncharacterized protein with ATP-grasp and redox domains